MRVCFFGTYREEYSRNKIVLASLRSAGIEVVECHETLWHGIEDRVDAVSGGWLKPKFWLRLIRTYSRLVRKYRKIGDYDILMVGYPGQFDVFLANWLRKKHRKPLVWDVFMSIYLIAVERNLHREKRSAVNWIKWLEGKALTLPEVLIQDTKAYVCWFHKMYGVDEARFRLIPTGADEFIFYPHNLILSLNPKFKVLFYGTFTPNHGIDLIVSAAEILKSEEDIEFVLIGDGPERINITRQLTESGLQNISQLGWIDQGELVTEISTSDLCLGAFGDTPQSMMTIHNKIYEAAACGKAILTGESPAIIEQYTNLDELMYCQRTPQAIADSITFLKNNPALLRKMGYKSLLRFRAEYSFSALGQRLLTYLEELK